MKGHRSRRDALRAAAGGLASLAALDRGAFLAMSQSETNERRGHVIGQPLGVAAGTEVLSNGGNAVDAAVTAALVAGVVDVGLCGLGGYGGHMVLCRGPGRPVVAIDYNSTAPRAARADMFPLDKNGRVRGNIHEHGWLAAGVPGVLAGMQLALERHGTLSFRQAVQPALRHARDGFDLSAAQATQIRNCRTQLARDAGSQRLYFRKDKPLDAGSRIVNADLAAMLETLARDNSVEAFYRGAIARRIADAFAKNGGLVTAADMAAFRAREVEPLELSWRGVVLHTAPLTAGGATVLQALAALKALEYEKREPNDPRTTQLRVEALRIAWHDRLKFFGDPDAVEVPTRRLLAPKHARQSAARIEEAVRQGRPVAAETDGRTADGTIHISAVDATGGMRALTFTHGGLFGARVTVPGLGLTLGHGMSRFDPHPEHPNAPGPGKRPLHNMCPTIVVRDGRPILAVGARGGRRIPNAVFDVLAAFVGQRASLEDAIAKPRMHTEGGLQVTLERPAPENDVAHLRKVGYTVETGASAVVSGVVVDPKSGTTRAAGR